MSPNTRYGFGFLIVLGLMVLGVAGAWAQAPQTIVIDGVNDFLPGNLIDADAGDTQHPEIDLGDLYVTNDAVNLYLGMTHDQGGWSTVQIGVAIDVNTADGGTTDPWGRAIEWSLADNKPDFMFYVNLDNNWQAGYSWDGAAWAALGSAGPGALGWSTGTGFRELAVMLGALGVSAGSTVNVEMWITQDGSTKGPLDAMANDGSQLSTPGFTLFDTTAPIPMLDYISHVVYAAADPDPPLLVEAKPGPDFPAESFFDVYFNEPMDEATANTPGNYVINGAVVTAATRSAADPSIVRLTLDTILPASAGLYTLTVSGVEDLAGNPIVEDGVGNTTCFMLKSVTFRGQFGPYLANLGVGPHSFSVEGDLAPLTFDPLCDTGLMVDTLVDDIWEAEEIFCVTGDCLAGTAVGTLNWKFVYNCMTYEPLASNREHILDLANGAADVIEVFWADEDPSTFTLHDIDVEFFVDMNSSAYLPGDTVGLNGSAVELGYNIPADIMLVDDGTGNDALAADGIFSTVVTFAAGARKDVAYKFLLNDVYECTELGDRFVFLNDELFDTVGGALGPLTLPVVHFDFCNAIWRPVEVVFSVDFNNTAWAGVDPSDVVAVNGTENNAVPPTFDWSVPSLNVLADDGMGFDAVAGDKIYTVSVVFPDTSAQNIDYKYLFNGGYECLSQGNRTAALDPDNFDAVGNPQILPVDVFQICNVVGVPDLPGFGLVLEQNSPNPFNPSTEIRFDVPRTGQGSLRVFNLRGELVRMLRSGTFEAGPGSVMWNGLNDAGGTASSGVYFYRLEVAKDIQTKRMVLLK
jgi:Bacterial Ig-like domain